MPPPHTQKTSHADLSAAELALVKTYADEHGMTVDQAATQLARQALAARYRRSKPMGKVVPFKRRR